MINTSSPRKDTFTPSAGIVSACERVFVAMAHTQTIRPIVEKYQQEILQKHQFTNRGELEGLKGNPRRGEVAERVILNPSEVFLLSLEDLTTFCSESSKRANELGLYVSSVGNCPLLEAENLQRQAERLFLEEMKEINGFDPDEVLCLGLDTYREYTRLSLMLIAPYCKTTGEIIKKYLCK